MITSETQVMEPVDVDLLAAPPANVAVMYVQSRQLPEGHGYSCFGMNSAERLAMTPAQRCPTISLATLAQGVDHRTTLAPRSVFGLMSQFSVDSRGLVDWLNRLRERHGSDLYLVVVDYTGAEIPWELLKLGPTSRSGWVPVAGSELSISRWQDIRDERPWSEQYAIAYAMELEPQGYAGRITAYVDTDNLEGARGDEQALSRAGAAFELRIQDLLRRLVTPEEGFGLVYLASHGHFSADPLKFVLGSATDDEGQLVLGHLRDEEFYLFEKSEVIVFLNTCHSGRMFQDQGHLMGERLRGFPELFLSKGAKGVIATTGYVNSDFASAAAERLLEMFRTGSQPVSTVLRNWRREVQEGLPPKSAWTSGDYVKLLNACMYVYYGNPQGRLQVAEDPK